MGVETKCNIIKPYYTLLKLSRMVKTLHQYFRKPVVLGFCVCLLALQIIFYVFVFRAK